MSNFSGPFTSKVDAYQGMLVFGYDYFRYINVSKYQTSKLNHQPPLWLIPCKKSLIWDSPPLQNTRLKDMNGVDAEEGQTLLEHVSQQKFNNKNKYTTGKWYCCYSLTGNSWDFIGYLPHLENIWVRQVLSFICFFQSLNLIRWARAGADITWECDRCIFENSRCLMNIYLYIVIQSLCFSFEKILQVADLGFDPFAHLIDKVSSEKTPKKQVGCHDTQGAFIQKHPEICTLKPVVFFSEAKNGLITLFRWYCNLN